MENSNQNNTFHQFETDQQGRGVQFNVLQDQNHPEHSERMAELFKEVSDSNPESIAEFLIRLNAIDKLKT